MSEVYSVIYTGKTKPTANQARLVALFSEKFKLGHDKAEKLITGGRAVTLKKDLDREKALKYREVLEKLGMIVEIDPDPNPVPEEPSYPSELTLESYSGGDDETTEVLDPSEHQREYCPKCGSGNMQLGICQDCGIVAAKYLAAHQRNSEPEPDEPVAEAKTGAGDPYTPPAADLEEQYEGEMVGPHSVSSGSAFSWVAGGWRLFKESPWSWMIAMIVWVIVNIVVAMVPFVGAIAVSILGPTLFAGFMIGCREQEEGGNFAISHLFAGFSQNLGQNLLVGVLYLVFAGLIVTVMMLVMFGSLDELVGLAASASMEPAMFLTTSVLLGFGLSMIAFTLLLMAYIFAPALVALDDLSAWEAMKFSFVGCWKNVLPLTLYSILVLLLFLLNGVFMLLSPILMAASVVLFVLGFLILFPIQIGALYTAYRDIYFD